MYFLNIASGSKGNATLIVHQQTYILIDMGISLIRLESALKQIKVNVDDIDIVLFTHNHSDHISGLKFFSPKKCFALKGTLPTSLSNILEPLKTYQMKDVEIIAIPTSHDAINPCGYLIKGDEESLLYITDTGNLDESLFDYFKNPTYLILESNHDISLLMATNRPYELKRRILSDHGHLCNEESAMLAAVLLGDNTQEIYLAHLSEEANTPEAALMAYKKVFSYQNIDLSKYKIACLNQYSPTLGGRYNEN